MKKKIVFLVKYFPPIKRPSGISTFMFDFVNKFADSKPNYEIHVISFREGKESQVYHRNNVIIHKVKNYCINAGRLTRKFLPDYVILVSGIYKPSLLRYWYFIMLQLIRLKKRGTKIYFMQATHFQNFKFPFLFSKMLTLFDRCIGCHERISNSFPIPQNRIATLYPGVSEERLKTGLFRGNGTKRIGFFGHFSYRKGADILVDAFLKANCKNTELVLIGGEGDISKDLQKKSKENIQISYKNYTETVLSDINSCNVIILPYRTSASVLGVAMSALEAAYYNVPLIGTKTPCLELIISPSTGIFFKNEVELIKLIKRIDKNDKFLENFKNGQKVVRRKFLIEKTIANFESELKENARI